MAIPRERTQHTRPVEGLPIRALGLGGRWRELGLGGRWRERVPRRYLFNLLLVFVAYFAGAKVGLHLAFANKNVTAVWPPTGISLGAMLLLGVRMWPSVALGALVSNLTNGAGAATSTLIMVGNVLAPVTAWWLLRRVVGVRSRLERVSDVAGVLILGGPVAMTVSASLGTLALATTGALRWSAYGSTWLTWWVGDAMGVVIVTPLILVAAARCWRSVRLDGWHGVEAAGVLACVAGTSVLVFLHTVPVTFLVLPVAAWAAVRFFQLGAGLAVATVAAVSIAATVNGQGPLVHGLSTTVSLTALQSLNGAIAVTTFMLAAASLQQAKARSALRADADELEELLRQERLAAFGDMTSVVSHDLRNPLTAITNSHYLLRASLGTRLDAGAAVHLERAERETARAVVLTQQILEYRRPRRLALSEVDLRDVVEQAVETTPPPAGVVLEVECASAPVVIDTDQMTQVLTNLASNAYEAMDAGGSLRLTGRVDGDTVVITAADDGPGFDEASIGRVFEPFFSTKRSGTGLGLAIVRRLVETHGGRIAVENRPTGGALVTVVVPRGVERSRIEQNAS